MRFADEELIELPETDVDELVEEVKKWTVILYNDEVNTFDFVIQTLVEVCDHDYIQAEQVSVIVHTKGKCDVKSGAYDDLEPVCSELLRRGLTAKIE